MNTLLISIFLLIGVQANIIRPGTKIFGGRPIPISDAPYMLSVREYGQHICGAVVISNLWALTSAECVDDYEGVDESPLRIRAGSTFRDKGGYIHKVSEVIRHEKYNSSSLEYNFALLKVSQPFNTRSGNIFPVSLPLCWTEPTEGQRATVLGWGRTETSKLSEILLIGDVRIADRKTCKTLESAYRNECIGYGKMFCAQGNGVDTCDGDKGGPIIINNTLVGITSFGIGCAKQFPGVYGNVGNYNVRYWIAQKTGNGFWDCIS